MPMKMSSGAADQLRRRVVELVAMSTDRRLRVLERRASQGDREAASPSLRMPRRRSCGCGEAQQGGNP
jgi:hypothetical protein